MTLDYGRDTNNTYDNIEDEKDLVIIFIESFVSNDGSSLISQVKAGQSGTNLLLNCQSTGDNTANQICDGGI